jgi:hypothetical protein
MALRFEPFEWYLKNFNRFQSNPSLNNPGLLPMRRKLIGILNTCPM